MNYTFKENLFLIFLSIALIAFALSLAVPRYHENSDAYNNLSKESKKGNDVTEFLLNDKIKKINDNLPSMVDEETRLDSIALKNKDVHYDYTLVDSLVENMDVDNFHAMMAPTVKLIGCKDQETRALLNEGRKLIILYRDKSSKPVATFVVVKSDCN